MNNEDQTNKSFSPLIGELSESLEDYIEIVFNLISEHKVARVRDIAKAKNVKMSSVVSALKRLDNEKLINYEAREYVELTEAGKDLAKRLTRRHNFLTRFLIDILQVNPQIAESDACSIEHSISPETMSRLYDFSEFLQSQTNGVAGILENFKKSYRNNEENR